MCVCVWTWTIEKLTYFISLIEFELINISTYLFLGLTYQAYIIMHNIV